MLQEASANDAVAGVEALQYQPPKCWEEEALQGVVVRPARNLWRAHRPGSSRLGLGPRTTNSG